MRYLHPLVLCCLCSFAPAVGAQPKTSKSRGPFAKSQHGLSVDAATCALDKAEVFLRNNGPSPILPQTWPGRAPDYRIASIVGAAVAPLIDIDAMSVGLDTIHADSSGVLIPPAPPNWAAMTFSVTRATVGASGPVRSEATAVDGAAGDLFSWHIRRGRFSGVTDKVYLAQNGVDLRTHCSPQVGDIDAHDMHMAASVSAATIAAMYQTPAYFYFSITNATVAAAPAAWWGADGPSGATILQTTWTGAAWSPITPLYSWRQLGLTQHDDIDALAAEPQAFLQPYANWLLFSTSTGLPDPLMIYCPLPVVGPTPYRANTGTTTELVSRRIGLGPGGGDDIDAICVLDPGDAFSPPFGGFQTGAPFDQFPPFPFPSTGEVSACAAREFIGLRTYVHGCPPAGCAGSTIALMLLGVPGNPAIASLSFVRPAGFNAYELLLPVPPGLFGAVLETRWAVADLAAIDLAEPVSIRF